MTMLEDPPLEIPHTAAPSAAPSAAAPIEIPHGAAPAASAAPAPSPDLDKALVSAARMYLYQTDANTNKNSSPDPRTSPWRDVTPPQSRVTNRNLQGKINSIITAGSNARFLRDTGADPNADDEKAITQTIAKMTPQEKLAVYAPLHDAVREYHDKRVQTEIDNGTALDSEYEPAREEVLNTVRGSVKDNGAVAAAGRSAYESFKQSALAGPVVVGKEVVGDAVRGYARTEEDIRREDMYHRAEAEVRNSQHPYASPIGSMLGAVVRPEAIGTIPAMPALGAIPGGAAFGAENALSQAMSGEKPDVIGNLVVAPIAGGVAHGASSLVGRVTSELSPVLQTTINKVAGVGVAGATNVGVSEAASRIEGRTPTNQERLSAFLAGAAPALATEAGSIPESYRQAKAIQELQQAHGFTPKEAMQFIADVHSANDADQQRAIGVMNQKLADQDARDTFAQRNADAAKLKEQDRHEQGAAMRTFRPEDQARAAVGASQAPGAAPEAGKPTESQMTPQAQLREQEQMRDARENDLQRMTAAAQSPIEIPHAQETQNVRQQSAETPLPRNPEPAQVHPGVREEDAQAPARAVAPPQEQGGEVARPPALQGEGQVASKDFFKVAGDLRTHLENIPEVRFAREEKAWNKAMATEGTPVKSDRDGWTGRIIDPANGAAHNRVLVEHKGVRSDDPETVQRWYPRNELTPTEVEERFSSPVAKAPSKPLEIPHTAEATNRLHRETSFDSARDMLKKTSGIESSQPEIHFANTRDLATGQGENKGVHLEFDKGFPVTEKTTKPGAEFAKGHGLQEFTGTPTRQELRDNLRAVELPTKIANAGGLDRNTGLASELRRLQKEGWTRTDKDGVTRFEKPPSWAKGASKGVSIAKIERDSLAAVSAAKNHINSIPPMLERVRKDLVRQEGITGNHDLAMRNVADEYRNASFEGGGPNESLRAIGKQLWEMSFPKETSTESSAPVGERVLVPEAEQAKTEKLRAEREALQQQQADVAKQTKEALTDRPKAKEGNGEQPNKSPAKPWTKERTEQEITAAAESIRGGSHADYLDELRNRVMNQETGLHPDDLKTFDMADQNKLRPFVSKGGWSEKPLSHGDVQNILQARGNSSSKLESDKAIVRNSSEQGKLLAWYHDTLTGSKKGILDISSPQKVEDLLGKSWELNGHKFHLQQDESGTLHLVDGDVEFAHPPANIPYDKNSPPKDEPFIPEPEVKTPGVQGSLLGERHEGSNIGSKSGNMFGSMTKGPANELEAQQQREAEEAKKLVDKDQTTMFSIGPGAAASIDPTFRAITGDHEPVPEDAPRIIKAVASEPAAAAHKATAIGRILMGVANAYENHSQAVKQAFQAGRDELARLGQKAFPALNRADPHASYAASALTSIPETKAAMIDEWTSHLKAIAKANGMPLDEFKTLVGAAMTEDQLRGVRDGFNEKARDAEDKLIGIYDPTTAIADLQDHLSTMPDDSELIHDDTGTKQEKNKLKRDLKYYTKIADDPEFEAQETAKFEKLKADSEESAKNVKTTISAEGSPFKTEADYKASHDNPAVQEAAAYIRQAIEPALTDFYKSSSKWNAVDEEGNPVEPPTRGKDFGLHLSLNPIMGEEGAPRGKLPAGGNVRNTLEKHSVLEKTATGAADSYELDLFKNLGNALDKSILPGTHAKFYQSLQDAGVAVEGKPGKPPTIDGQPTVGLDLKFHPGLKLYVRGDVAPEVRNALAIDRPDRPFRPAGFMNRIPLISGVEAMSHIANQIPHLLTKPTAGGIVAETAGRIHPTLGKAVRVAENLPVLKVAGILDAVGTKAFRLAFNDLVTKGEVTSLARAGGLQPPTPRSLSASLADQISPKLGNVVEAVNPLSLIGHSVRGITNAMRLSLADGFKLMTDAHIGVKDTEANRRDFVNQAGNYHRESAATIVRWLKDSAIGPFATAGSARVSSGFRMLAGFAPGVEGTFKARTLLRAYGMAQIGGLLAMTALVNYARTGKMQPNGIPAGSLYLGPDKDGNPRYEDVADLIGVRGAMRNVGADAALKAKPGERLNAGLRQAISSNAGPAMGPIPTFGVEAATGVNPHGLYSLGPKTGVKNPVENITQAIRTMNPSIGSLTDPRNTGLGAQFGKFGPRTGKVEEPQEVTESQIKTAAKKAEYRDETAYKFSKMTAREAVEHLEKNPANRTQKLRDGYAQTYASEALRKVNSSPTLRGADGNLTTEGKDLLKRLNTLAK